jgi:hypothetical protein
MSVLSQFARGGIKSVQRGTISLASPASVVTATISSVDVNKSFISHLGQTTTATDPRYYETRLALTSSTQITATRGVGSGSAVVSYEVIEFY